MFTFLVALPISHQVLVALSVTLAVFLIDPDKHKPACI